MPLQVQHALVPGVAGQGEGVTSLPMPPCQPPTIVAVIILKTARAHESPSCASAHSKDGIATAVKQGGAAGKGEEEPLQKCAKGTVLPPHPSPPRTLLAGRCCGLHRPNIRGTVRHSRRRAGCSAYRSSLPAGLQGGLSADGPCNQLVFLACPIWGRGSCGSEWQASEPPNKWTTMGRRGQEAEPAQARGDVRGTSGGKVPRKRLGSEDNKRFAADFYVDVELAIQCLGAAREQARCERMRDSRAPKGSTGPVQKTAGSLAISSWLMACVL